MLDEGVLAIKIFLECLECFDEIALSVICRNTVGVECGEGVDQNVNLSNPVHESIVVLLVHAG